MFVHVRAGLCLAAFLESTIEGASMDLATSVKHFLWVVKLIQRRWRKLKGLRAARLELYTYWFRRLEPEVLRNIPMKTKRQIKRASEFHRPCPGPIVEDLLTNLIQQHQNQWRQAMFTFKHDETNRFCGSITGLSAASPRMTSFRSIDVEKLIIDTHDKWRNGEFDGMLKKLEDLERKSHIPEPPRGEPSKEQGPERMNSLEDGGVDNDQLETPQKLPKRKSTNRKSITATNNI